jgi:hypothetical protein
MATKTKKTPDAKKYTRSRSTGISVKRKSIVELTKLSAACRVNRAMLAHMLGVTEPTLATWVAGKPASAKDAAKTQRVGAILKTLTGVMRRSFIPTWLAQPNPACAELDARNPLDLMSRGDYETVEGMLFHLGSGVAF